MKPFLEDALRYGNFVGLNPLNFNKFRCVVFLLLAAGFVVQPILYLLFKRGEDFLNTVADSTGICQDIFKLYLMVVRRQEIAKLIHSLDDLWSPKQLGEAIEERMNTIYYNTKKLVAIVKFSYPSLLILYLCKILIARDRSLITACYLFSVDINETPVYQSVLVYQTISGILVIISVTAFDILFICFIYNALCQFRLIKEGFESMTINSNNLENEEKSLTALKVLVNHHSKSLKFVNDLDTCYQYNLLLHFLCSSFCLTGVLLSLSINDGSSNFGQTAKYIAFLIAFIGEMFWYCFAGTLLAKESESVAFAIYNTKWWIKTQPKLRKGFVLGILRSQHTAKLTAGGIVDLNLQSFTSTVKTGYSLFAVIRTLYSNQET